MRVNSSILAVDCGRGSFALAITVARPTPAKATPKTAKTA